jgi:hypothetical protein
MLVWNEGEDRKEVTGTGAVTCSTGEVPVLVEKNSAEDSDW